MISEQQLKVLVIVMAAGFSRRFGNADKRNAALSDGRTLLATTLSQLQRGTCAANYQLAVVIRPEDDAATLGIPEDLPLLRAPAAERGLGGSISDAVRSVSADPAFAAIDSLAIMLGDMPAIQPETLSMLVAAGRPNSILRPRYQGLPGHPVLFGRDFWPELLSLEGEEGARAVIRANAASLFSIDVGDEGVVVDIDTPEQLAQQRTGR